MPGPEPGQGQRRIKGSAQIRRQNKPDSQNLQLLQQGSLSDVLGVSKLNTAPVNPQHGVIKTIGDRGSPASSSSSEVNCGTVQQCVIPGMSEATAQRTILATNERVYRPSSSSYKLNASMASQYATVQPPTGNPSPRGTAPPLSPRGAAAAMRSTQQHMNASPQPKSTIMDKDATYLQQGFTQRQVFEAPVGPPQPPPLPGTLVFDCSFEGGNVAGAQCIGDEEYEITLRHDTLNARHRLWFHFAVSNCSPGQQVLLSIVNFSKARSLYRNGMSPVVRSAKRPAWCRIPPRNAYFYKSARHRGQQVLTVAFMFDDPEDVYEFAYSFPFTYTALQYELGYMEFLELPYLRRQLLARTPQLRRVDLLTISQPLLPCPLSHRGPIMLPGGGVHGADGPGAQAPERRPVVFVTGRVHPGETPSSYLVQGLINFLLGPEPLAAAARAAATWVIVPMLNPDGVFLGNYRTDAGGVDLNRLWSMPNPATLPALYHTLQLIQGYAAQPSMQVDLFIDVHAHSTSRTSFTYCNMPDAQGGQQQQQAAVERVTRLPRLLDANMPGFSLSSCVFDDSPAKSGCARRVVGNLLPDVQCYTLEVSFFHAEEMAVMVQPGDAGTVSSTNTIEGYLGMGRQLAISVLQLYSGSKKLDGGSPAGPAGTGMHLAAAGSPGGSSSTPLPGSGSSSRSASRRPSAAGSSNSARSKGSTMAVRRAPSGGLPSRV